MGGLFSITFTIMKTIFVLLAIFSIACAQIARKSVSDALIDNGKDGCLTCVDDIVKAVADCSAEGANILNCITEAIGAASDCVHCICEVLEIIGGFDDVCP